MSKDLIVAAACRAPLPLKDGYALRVYHLLAELCREFQVVFIAPESAGWADKGELNFRERIIVPTITRTYGELQDVLADPESLRETTQKAVDRVRPAMMILWSGAENGLLMNRTNLPTLVDRIDSMMLMRWRDFRHAGSWKEKASYFREFIEAGIEERRILKNSDATVVVGGSDARALQRLGRIETVHVVSNGVVPADEQYVGKEASVPTVMFSGVMSYPPNVDAVCYFVEKVWPMINRQVNDARFCIVGKSPIFQVNQLANERGVEVLGEVDEMPETLAQAWVCVAPMKSGAGIKNKILEACALGKPVVITHLASNGLDTELCDSAIVCSRDADMADAVVKLLQSSELRIRLGSKLRSYVELNYGWREKGQQLVRIIRTIIDPCKPEHGDSKSHL